jgi:hypothetical protein
VPAVTLQVEVGPVHRRVFDAEHTPQAPDGWQAGVAPPHSASLAQPRHACVAASQVGALAPHWVLVRQPTQVPLATLHTEVAPVHRAPLVAEQVLHEPLG